MVDVDLSKYFDRVNHDILIDRLRKRIDDAGVTRLGYSLWVGRGGEVKRKVAAKPLAAFKQRIRELTGRSGGRSMPEVVERLRSYRLGWKGDFRLAQTPGGGHSMNGCVTGCGRSSSSTGSAEPPCIGNG